MKTEIQSKIVFPTSRLSPSDGQFQDLLHQTPSKQLFLAVAALGIVLVGAGCISSQLKDSTLAQGRTLTDLEYRMVLDNIASYRRATNYALIPWHLIFIAGDVSIKDTFSAGNPSLSYAWDPISRTVGVSASRNWQENWTVSPVVDYLTLDRLRGFYTSNAMVTWVHDGIPPQETIAITGNDGDRHVWVDIKDVTKLTDFTLTIMGVVYTNGDYDFGINPTMQMLALPIGPPQSLR